MDNIPANFLYLLKETEIIGPRVVDKLRTPSVPISSLQSLCRSEFPVVYHSSC